MTHQVALTVIAKIKPGETDNLKQLLGTIHENRGKKNIIPFEKFSNIHFARLMVLDEAKDLNGNMIQPSLALLSNFDAPLDKHLEDREHFGFRDNIADPAIAGTDQKDTPENTISAGEFILGYANGYGQYTNSPVVKAERERHNFRSPIPTTFTRRRSLSGLPTRYSDCGRDGNTGNWWRRCIFP